MDRITEKLVNYRFEQLCKALGKRVATKYDDHGAWRLDYIYVYGGYQIQEIDKSGQSSAVSLPFGMERRSRREMYEALTFALRALAINQDEETGSYWPKDKEITA